MNKRMKNKLLAVLTATLALLVGLTASNITVTKANYQGVVVAGTPNGSPHDATSTGTSTVHSTGTGEDIIPTAVTFFINNKSGTILTPAVVSVGTNSPNYDNLVSATVLGTVVDNSLTAFLTSNTTKIAANSDIKVKVTTAAAGISPVLDFSVYVSGFIPQ